MNQKQPKPQDLLNVIYSYFCKSLQKDNNIYLPKNIVRVEQCFQELNKLLQEKNDD